MLHNSGSHPEPSSPHSRAKESPVHRSWSLPIANYGRRAWLVAFCLPQQENNIFLERTHHVQTSPLLRFPSRFVQNLPSSLTVSICSHLLLMIFLSLCPDLLRKQTNKQTMDYLAAKGNNTSACRYICKPPKIY